MTGEGCESDLTPFEVAHGSINALGCRVEDMAYRPDVSDIPDTAWNHLHNLKLWIVDALRYDPHSSHTHVEKTLGWIKVAKPEHSIITNMHVDLDYATLQSELPPGVEPAFDMMTKII